MLSGLPENDGKLRFDGDLEVCDSTSLSRISMIVDLREGFTTGGLDKEVLLASGGCVRRINGGSDWFWFVRGCECCFICGVMTLVRGSRCI